uniref:Uncharacterized protein n=1 Tax=Glossina pallidipes TaxID=7398 RepID=A0A1B0A435_GLOPL
MAVYALYDSKTLHFKICAVESKEKNSNKEKQRKEHKSISLAELQHPAITAMYCEDVSSLSEAGAAQRPREGNKHKKIYVTSRIGKINLRESLLGSRAGESSLGSRAAKLSFGPRAESQS